MFQMQELKITSTTECKQTLSIQLLRQSWICYECVMCWLTHPSNPFGVEYLCVSPHLLCSLQDLCRYSDSFILKHFPSLISTL